jgi:phage baseplate assembly protein V
MIKTINKMMAPLSRRVGLMVARGMLALANDTLKMQGVQVQLLDGEVREMERLQNYGFSSRPHPGAEVATVFVGGNRDHGLALAIDDRRYRVRGLQSGEVVIYDDIGHRITLTRNGIAIDGGGHNLTIANCPQVVLSDGDVIADGISLKTHKHGDVQAGSAQTGGPV